MGDNGSLDSHDHEPSVLIEIACLRRELELVSKLLTGYGNGDIDALEDTKRAHHFHSHCEISGTIVSENFEDLKQLSHEQLIKHFNIVMNQMKREHDYTIQEMTEDYFSIKRRCLKLEQHGASFSSSNKNNEFDILRKKIPDFISKMENILLEYDKSVFEGKRDAEFNSLSEADHKISQLTQVEENHRKLIQKLQTDLEDSRVEASIYKEETDLENYIMREAFELIARDLVASKSKIDLQDSWVESYMTEEYSAVIYKEALKETLRSEMVNKERLKGEIHWLECLVKEKENLFRIVENDSATQRENSFEQINNLQFQIDQQAAVIQDKNTQLKSYEMEISELRQELELARKNMKITENDKVNCEVILSSMVLSLAEWSKAFDNLECRVAQKTKKTNSRLRSMQRQLSNVSDKVDELKARKFMYKQQTEQKTCDLEKAETEVDLLGTEVESLLDLLKKIYIALDHYSPILKHYPGIIEILKLVRRELRGESKRYSVC